MRRNLKNLRLRAIAAVDDPCQEHAKALIIKRRADPVDRPATAAFVAKYICDDDGAHTFQEVLDENKFSQEVWPCVDALSQSIRSIVGDTSLTGGEREAKIGASVEQFLSAVRDISPEVSKQLAELCGKKEEGPMPKTIEELQADVTKLTSDVTTANSRADTEKARAEKAESDLKAEQAAHGETKKALTAATDETITVGDVELKKSEVGEASFKVSKALAAERDMARIEKRVETEFRHVVGSATEKAKVLKLVNDLPEDNETRKALEAILKSAEKMVALGFENTGSRGGVEPTVKAAQATFDQKVKDIAKRDEIPEHQAMRKARTEFPTEFAAAYPEQAPQPAAN
jgi:hypothetical protein